MILHILRFRFKPLATEEQIAGVVASMHRFAEIPQVEQLVVGQDISADGYYSHAMIVTVADVEAMRQYHAHSIHATADRNGLPLIENVMSFDASDDMDRAIGGRLQDIVAQRMTARPDIAALAGAAQLTRLVTAWRNSLRFESRSVARSGWPSTGGDRLTGGTLPKPFGVPAVHADGQEVS